MKKLSHWMPESSYGQPRSGGEVGSVRQPSVWPVLVLTLALMADIIPAYITYTTPWFALFVVLAFVLFFGIIQTLETNRLRLLAVNRTEESICTFARQFDCRTVDTWILRAVYEELSGFQEVDGVAVPIRAEDSWDDDLKRLPEDLYDELRDIAHRARRSMENTEQNPLYGRVETVRDMVAFLQHQPALPKHP